MRPGFSFLFLFSILLITFSTLGCLSSTGTGILTGTMTIGPLCPVETIPPQPECEPTLATYQQYPVKVSRLVTNTQAYIEVTSFTANVDGTYRIELAPGHYRLQVKSGTNGSLVKEVDIQRDQTTVINFDIDTGIR